MWWGLLECWGGLGEELNVSTRGAEPAGRLLPLSGAAQAMARTATVAPAAAAALLLCALLAAQPLRSSAHGMLTIPPARNWLAWINEKCVRWLVVQQLHQQGAACVVARQVLPSNASKAARPELPAAMRLLLPGLTIPTTTQQVVSESCMQAASTLGT